jgi:rhodanese-related sulfurtransferase
MKSRTATLIATATLAVCFASYSIADGNRYNRDRQYASDISASEAYKKTKLGSRVASRLRGEKRPIIIDVRRLEEFAAGHPIGSFNVPYPSVSNICTNCEKAQVAENFYWEVYDIVRGNLDREILLLCRTGSRSIDAGNILADPENTALDPRRDGKEVYGVEPFTNVRNIWEGFVGQPRYAYQGGSVAWEFEVDEDGIQIVDEDGNPKPQFFPLDLNNNGVVDSDTADVYEERKDKNEDKDGWRNFLGLAWTTKFRWWQAYLQDPSLYESPNLILTPVSP